MNTQAKMKSTSVIQLTLLSVVIAAIQVHWVGGSVPERSQMFPTNDKDLHHRERRQSENLSVYAEDKSTDSCTQLLRGRDGRDGRDGKDGKMGEPGQAGAKGEKGDPGRNGEKGAHGDAGIPGHDATNSDTSGTTYVRWGRTTCPSTSELVYEGIVGGNEYRQVGGAANYLCMPLVPEYLQVVEGTGGGRSLLYSTEYQIESFAPFGDDLNQHNAPCAVCRVIGRSTLLMIPARISCPSNDWTSEYKGYLMTAYYGHAHQTEYVCLDENAESRPGTEKSTDGSLMYLVEATCGAHGLPCDPYEVGRELACVMCTI